MALTQDLNKDWIEFVPVMGWCAILDSDYFNYWEHEPEEDELNFKSGNNFLLSWYIIS